MASTVTAGATRVHEIRVHGVNNSPPAEMLETTPDAIRVATGDGSGVFYERIRSRPEDGVHSVEAYSWGAQSRTGGGALAGIGTALVHVGWFLLLPYAMVNLAYWTRTIPEQSRQFKTWTGGPGAGTVRLFGLLLTLLATVAFTTVAVDLVAMQCFDRVRGLRRVCSALPGALDGLAGWSPDARAALLGAVPVLVLTVLYLISRRGRVGFEPALESFGGTLAGEDEPGRPLLATPGFWTNARMRDTSEWLHLAAATFLVVGLLSFRADSDDLARWGFASVAAAGIGVCAVALVVAGHTPPSGTGVPPMRGVLRPLAPVVRMATAPGMAPVTRTARRRTFAFLALVVAGLVYAGWWVWVAQVGVDRARGSAFDTAPTVLVAAGLLLALQALTWSRASVRRSLGGAALLVAAGGCFLATLLVPGGLTAGVVTAAGMALIGVHAALCLWPPAGVRGIRKAEEAGEAEARVRAADTSGKPGAADAVAAGPRTAGEQRAARRRADRARRQRRRDADPTTFAAWHGRGAAIAMLLALLLSLALSSLLVLGVSAWLSALPAGGTRRFQRELVQPLRPSEWSVPDAYEKAAIVLLGVVALTVVLLVVVGVRLMRQAALRRFTLPTWAALDEASPAVVEERAEDRESGVTAPGDDYPDAFDRADPDDPPLLARHLRAERTAERRRLSQTMHRGEPLAAWVAAITAAGLLVLVSPGTVELTRLGLEEAAPGSPTGIRVAAVSALAVVALAAVAKVVADAVSRTDRPLGTFWDVVGFLPRAGHPFAPPCFAERAVPELVARVRELTRGASTPPRPPQAVLLSAHSMGSTISAAVIFALRGDRATTTRGEVRPVTDAVALLSFGTQLRGYFSRFFPSVLGYDVLGVPRLRGPSLFAYDPWVRQVEAEFPAAAHTFPPRRGDDRAETTLTGLLGAHDEVGPRWRSLWRRTDFLGFPVFGYPSAHNPIDRGASEVAPGYSWRLATHSPYLGQDAFRLARRELAAELSVPEPAPAPPP